MLNSNSKQQISRYDLKKQLQGIQSFDMSSFCDSKNQSTGFKAFINHHNFNLNSNNQIIFPTVNAPTLELLESEDYHVLKVGKEQRNKIKNNFNAHNEQSVQYLKEYEQEYDQNITARNRSILNNNHNHESNLNNHNNQNLHEYEQKIFLLKNQLSSTLQKYQNQIKEKSKLQQQLKTIDNNYKQIIEQYKYKNKQQKDQIKQLKQRQIRIFRQKEYLQKQYQNSIAEGRVTAIHSTYNNSIGRSTVSTVSFVDDPIGFSPELLSPEQTVLLLSKLLRKVSKSTRMIEQLTTEPNIKTILNKIHKRQF